MTSIVVYTERRPQCATILNQETGERCTKHAEPGRRNCRWHGGATRPAGPTHHSYKHGLYTRALPPHLAEIADRSANDPRILELNQAIGVTDARVVELLMSLQDGGMVGESWEEMLSIFEGLAEILQDGDRVTYEDTADERMVLQLLSQGDRLLSTQVANARIWDKVFTNLETRRKLVDTESRRRKDAQTMLTADQAFAVVHQLVLAVRRHVTDPATLKSISADLQSIISKTLPQQPQQPEMPLAAMQAGAAAAEIDPHPPQEIEVDYSGADEYDVDNRDTDDRGDGESRADAGYGGISDGDLK